MLYLGRVNFDGFWERGDGRTVVFEVTFFLLLSYIYYILLKSANDVDEV